MLEPNGWVFLDNSGERSVENCPNVEASGAVEFVPSSNAAKEENTSIVEGPVNEVSEPNLNSEDISSTNKDLDDDIETKVENITETVNGYDDNQNGRAGPSRTSDCQTNSDTTEHVEHAINLGTAIDQDESVKNSLNDEDECLTNVCESIEGHLLNDPAFKESRDASREDLKTTVSVLPFNGSSVEIENGEFSSNKEINSLTKDEKGNEF